jgi:hypothetical protein
MSNIKSMGGNVDEEDQELMKDSPLYHIYHIGSEEISHRLDKMSLKRRGPSRPLHPSHPRQPRCRDRSRKPPPYRRACLS